MGVDDEPASDVAVEPAGGVVVDSGAGVRPVGGVTTPSSTYFSAGANFVSWAPWATFSNAYAIPSSSGSENAGPSSWRLSGCPTGLTPAGKIAVGTPAFEACGSIRVPDAVSRAKLDSFESFRWIVEASPGNTTASTPCSFIQAANCAW